MQQNKPIVWFRADGNSSIGLGHVVRSLALAELLAEYFDCRFLIRNPSENLKVQILSVCSTLVELDNDIDILQDAQNLTEQHFKANDLVVLDGYHFTTHYQQIVKKNGSKLVCIDDIYAYPFLADAIINHAGGIYPSHYKALPETKFYLGLQYALLRSPFRIAAATRPQHRYSWQNMFICLGGADPNNETLKVLEIVTKHSLLDTYFVVVGSAYLHLEALMAFIQDSSSRIILRQRLDAAEMVVQMQQCAIAVCSPSTVAFEYLSVGGTALHTLNSG
ncbi:MAG: UDP-2,4-diacetamido-2,4,6-trideoxy-beta-L-altropyranose hydrolase [Saprospiraceae bacterium]|nr:UDP-2,4-diacetamido-2,4,6-trideoxy-beta-L-altropyranose hydrolase [Saprospiraceae bacterium]